MGLNDSIEYALNTELSKRLLVRFFCERGFSENFDKRVYPPMLQSLCEKVPELSTKLELVPYASEIDPNSGFARLGWNLFALGNQRLYLGETEHTNLQELARQLDVGEFSISESAVPARQQRTAREIISWITRVLSNSKGGLIRSTDRANPLNTINLRMAQSNSNSFYEKPRSANPQ